MMGIMIMIMLCSLIMICNLIYDLINYIMILNCYGMILLYSCLTTNLLSLMESLIFVYVIVYGIGSYDLIVESCSKSLN